MTFDPKISSKLINGKLTVKWHSIIILNTIVVVNKNNKVLFLAAKLFRDFNLFATWSSDILTELGELPVPLRDPVTSCQPRGSVDLGFYRDDDQGSAFERHRGRVLFDMDKHNTMEKACRHLIDFMEIKGQVERSGKVRTRRVWVKAVQIRKDRTERLKTVNNCNKGSAGNGAAISVGKCNKWVK